MTNIYVSKDNINTCKMCNKVRDLRMGWCWDCATAQNILHCGKDMFQDETGEEVKIPVALINERLKMLIDKGWGTGTDKAKINTQNNEQS